MSVTLVWAHPNESTSRQATGGLCWVMNQQEQIKARGLHTIVSQSVFSPDDTWNSPIDEKLGGAVSGRCTRFLAHGVLRIAWVYVAVLVRQRWATSQYHASLPSV